MEFDETVPEEAIITPVPTTPPRSRKRQRTTSTSTGTRDYKPWRHNFKSLSVYPSKKYPGKVFLYGRGRYGYGRQYMRGRGRYGAPWLGQRLGSATGAVVGNWLAPGIGASLGEKAGGWLGNKLGQGFRSITGFGDYSVHENSLLFPEAQVPSFGEDSIRVKKREFIGTINGSEDFQNLFMPVNPGLDSTFPWLSKIATNYEQYRWNGCVFQFVTTCSDFSSQVGIGQVMLASDYNAADSAFINPQQMLGTMFSTSSKPSQNILHAIECAPQDMANKLYYVRSGDTPQGTDIRLYDMLSFQIATQGIPSPQTPYVPTPIGQLWVSYDVTFTKSVQNNSVGFDINTDQWSMHPSIGGIIPLPNWIDNSSLAKGSNIGTSLNRFPDPTSLNIDFPPLMESGYYLIVLWMQASGGWLSGVDWSATGTNCSLTAGGEVQAPQGGVACNESMLEIVVRLDKRSATVHISADAFPETGNNLLELTITQVNGELYQ